MIKDKWLKNEEFSELAENMKPEQNTNLKNEYSENANSKVECNE